MEIVILGVSIIAVICGILIGLSIKNNKIVCNNIDCIDNYEMMLRCKKLFVTTHYNTLTDYNIIDINDYFKQGIIRIDYYRARTAEAGETHGRTYLYETAMVYTKKGDALLEWKQL